MNSLQSMNFEDSNFSNFKKGPTQLETTRTPNVSIDDGLYSEHIEKALLTSLIARPVFIPQVLPKLRPKDFVTMEARCVYLAIENLYIDACKKTTLLKDTINVDVSSGSICEQLIKQEQFGIGENKVRPEYVSNLLVNPVASPDSCMSYVDKLQKYTLRRDGVKKAEESKKGFLNPKIDPNDSLKDLIQSAMELDRRFISSEEEAEVNATVYLDDLLRPFSEEELSNLRPLPITGIAALDGWNGGLPIVQMSRGIILSAMARTGNGKTLFSLQSMIANTELGLNGVIFSNELLKQPYVDKISAILTGRRGSPISTRKLEVHRVTKNALSKQEIVLMKDAWEEYRSWKGHLQIVPISGKHGKQVCMDGIQRHNLSKIMGRGGIDVFSLDYINRVSTIPSQKNDSMTDRIAGNLSEFSNLIKITNSHGIVLGQVSRTKNEKDEEGSGEIDFNLDSAHGSASFEWYAQYILGLAIAKDKQSATIKVFKASLSGEAGRLIKVGFDGPGQAFE